MRILACLAVLASVSCVVVGCNKSSSDTKSSSSSDDKSDKKKNKKSGDDDDDDKGGASKCTTSFNEASKDQNDNGFDFKCPADCDPKAASVWGSGWYTSDSAICLAAIHSGAVKASKGGKVSVKAKKGLKKYLGTKANGVTTFDYGSYDGSFSVNDSDDGNGTPKKGEAEKISCSDSVNSLDHKDEDSFKVVCPPGCKDGGTVWGTDTYTSDSAICRAAVLQGVVTNDDGGNVTVKVGPGLKSYAGSKKNGVKSEDYGDYDTSYTLQ